MISDNNELIHDSHDEDLQNFDDPDKGFELDKLEIPKPSVTDESKTVTGQTTDIESQDTPKPEALSESESLKNSTRVSRPRKAGRYLLLLVISSGLAVFLGIIGFISIKLSQFDMTKVPTGGAPVGTYQAIEPIVTNLGDSNYVYIVLMLRSPSEQHTQFMALKSKVIDAVFNILGSEDVQRQVAYGGPASIKSVLYTKITTLLDEKYPNQVILSEVRLN